MLELREELKEGLKEGLKDENKLSPAEPPMDFWIFKNLASDKAGALEGYVVRIADGLIGTIDEGITGMITERSKLTELYYDNDNKTGHTFMNFLHFLYDSLELTGRMVGYIKDIVVNPDNYKNANGCPNDPSDPIFSPMNDVLNNICVKCGSIKTDLYMISEEFRSQELEKENSDRKYDVNHTTGVLEYINNELFIILDSCDNILTTIYGAHWNDTEKVYDCETKAVR